jgi:hypothetical protein
MTTISPTTNAAPPAPVTITSMEAGDRVADDDVLQVDRADILHRDAVPAVTRRKGRVEIFERHTVCADLMILIAGWRPSPSPVGRLVLPPVAE